MRFSEPGFRQHRHPKRFAFFVPLLLAAAAAAGWLVMTLWNAVLVEALGARPLGYWQALGLLLLCRVLFGNWGPRRMGPARGWAAPGGPDAPGAPNEKGGSLSPEQRERFRAHWKARCTPKEAPPPQRPGD